MTDGKAMDIFPDDIGFQIDDSPWMLIHEGRIGHGMGNDGNGKLAVADGYDGQADAVDGDRAFFDDERFHIFRDGNGNDPGNAVRRDAGDMAALALLLGQVSTLMAGIAARNAQPAG